MALDAIKTSDPADLDSIAEVCWEAFNNPKVQFVSMMCRPQGRADEITYMRDNWIKPSYGTPQAHFWKVEDGASGNVLGAANIIAFESGRPYDGMPPPEAKWWPEGEEREFASTFVSQMHKFRLENMNRPHACSSIFRIPEKQNAPRG